MKIRVLFQAVGLTIFFYMFPLHANLSQFLESEILSKFRRPVTILYISNDPEPIELSDRNVVVVWSNSKKDISDSYKKANARNVIILKGPVCPSNMVFLAECEHFDVAVIEYDIEPAFFQNKAHLADFTLLVSSKRIPALEKLGSVSSKDIYLKHYPKSLLKKNWWRSLSHHGRYKIVSSFSEKYLVKPKQYVDAGVEKSIKWTPGINLYTFFQLGGIFPPRTYLREKVLEVFDPAICNDFGLANVILQGLTLRIIDFDTTYGEDPYERLRRTIELQMNLKYK